jgi:hypothetical protein
MECCGSRDPGAKLSFVMDCLEKVAPCRSRLTNPRQPMPRARRSEAYAAHAYCNSDDVDSYVDDSDKVAAKRATRRTKSPYPRSGNSNNLWRLLRRTTKPYQDLSGSVWLLLSLRRPQLCAGLNQQSLICFPAGAWNSPR